MYPVGVQNFAKQHAWQHHVVDIDGPSGRFVRRVGLGNPRANNGFLFKHSIFFNHFIFCNGIELNGTHAEASASTTAATASTTLV